MRSSLRIPDCPLARAVSQIADSWTLEILHELFDGNDRFDDIRRNLQLSPDTLTQRLASLADRGLVRQVHESSSETRFALTALSWTFRPLLLIMAACGNDGLPPAQRSLILIDSTTGEQVEPIVVDKITGRRIDGARYAFTAGPGASAAMRDRYPNPLSSMAPSPTTADHESQSSMPR